MIYEEKIKRLNTLSKFINGNNQDDILLMLDKKYKDNKWSTICSVIHWFNVVETYLDCNNVLKENTKDYNWGNVYLYLCSVDIVTKGINDLYKIVTNNNIHIFKGEKDVFNDKNIDDNDYFQNIRAVFGAHPTKLDGNGDYIVASYPTPYNSKIDLIKGEPKSFDYYTLLWSKKKTNNLDQIQFGFSFVDVDKYLDKHIMYLEVFYEEIINMINDYKKNISLKKINIIDDFNKQIDLLLIEDKKRFNEKYKYDLEKMKVLINIKISDEQNEKKYSEFKDLLISLVPKVYGAIQNPIEYDNIDFLNNIIDCEIQEYDSHTSYYYSKLLEYNNNYDMEMLLIDYFKDKIRPFNENILSIEELFCIVIASNYYKKNNIY